MDAFSLDPIPTADALTPESDLFSHEKQPLRVEPDAPWKRAVLEEQPLFFEYLSLQVVLALVGSRLPEPQVKCHAERGLARLCEPAGECVFLIVCRNAGRDFDRVRSLRFRDGGSRSRCGRSRIGRFKVVSNSRLARASEGIGE